VNQLLGDIVKVTPTSKAVGDMALFLVTNDLTCVDVLDTGRDIAFPQSAIDLVGGRMGQAVGGFPRKVRDRILRGEKPLRGRPGSSLPAADFQRAKEKLKESLSRDPSQREIVSHFLYPEVFEEFSAYQQKYSDTSILPTPAYFFALEPGEEICVDIEPGKTLIIKFLTVGDPHEDSMRTVFFELNGQPREVTVVDHALDETSSRQHKADPTNSNQVGAGMPGMVVTIAVRPGDQVVKGQKLLMIEAMKMQTTLTAERSGRVSEVHVQPGTQVDAGDLLVSFDEPD
jgi:pyruvate carboxylase